MTTPALQERRTRTLKHGDTFAVFDHRGDIGADPGNSEGLFHRDTRILSRFALRLQGALPLLLSSTLQDDDTVFSADLSNPDCGSDGKIVLRREQIHLQRLRFLWSGCLYERVRVQNFADRTVQIGLCFDFAADFADLFEVRGAHRAARGTTVAQLEGPAAVSLRYRGLDEIERTTRLSFDPPPSQLERTCAEFVLTVQPHEAHRLFIAVGAAAPRGADWHGCRFYREMRAARRALRRAAQRAAVVETSNAVFNDIARRSISDLNMLITDTPQGPYPYAGTPWFSTPFGRDGIITALMTLWLDPAIARGVLGFLAATQATAIDPDRDAEPGKILHEMRHGEMANLREVPFGRYYGSVDATPLFVLLLGEYYERTADLDFVRALWPHALAALHWIDVDGDRDRDGFLEYHRRTESGLSNQGWKDSQDAIFHHDGRCAEGPIALCEVQAYVYGAKRHAATLAAALGDPTLAARLDAEADDLRERFEAQFWCEDLSVYALALDGAKRPCRVVSSNSGQVLLTGIASQERAQRVAAALLEPACFSGWGIRTVSSAERRYNPMSYHNGSVWPHDNGLIALGFARYGLRAPVNRVAKAVFDAAAYMDLRRLPELFCGFSRRQRNAPTQYPVACSPQAWASATPLALLQALLGLKLIEGSKQIAFHRPCLPAFLDSVWLRNLRLQHGSADVRLHRAGDELAAAVTRCSGDVDVVIHQ